MLGAPITFGPGWLCDPRPPHSPAVAIATRCGGLPARSGPDRLEQANLNYWAYSVSAIGDVQVDDEFMGRVDPRGVERRSTA